MLEISRVVLQVLWTKLCFYWLHQDEECSIAFHAQDVFERDLYGPQGLPAIGADFD